MTVFAYGRALWVLAAAWAVALAPSPLRAEETRCARPKLELIRYEEDYSVLAHPACRSSSTDNLKYLRLGRDAYLSLGADLRVRYEYLRHPDWERAPTETRGYVLHRLMLHSDLNMSRRFRTFVQLKSALRGGNGDGARPSDVDELDLHQAFLEARIGGSISTTVRIGRQEIAYGSSRLISIREGPNVRRSFDGLRLVFAREGLQIDALVLSAVATNPGIFDDGSEHRNRLWGLYSTSALPARGARVDLYYIGLLRPRAEFDQGIARELRHSVGSRLFGELAQADYNIEVVYQFGRFGDDRIRAWTAASETGYTFRGALRPRAGLRADITSGDRSPLRGNLQTFNPLYPRGNYFGEAALFGPMNHRDIHPSLEVNPTASLSVRAEWLFFFRDSSSDAVYRVSTGPQVDGSRSRRRYVGSQAGLNLEWQVGPNISLLGAYLHFFPGTFLDRSGLGKHVDFIALWLTCRM